MTQRILIAEPMKAERVELERILTGEGYQVETVTEGGVVIDKIQTDLYDVLLLDLSIPARSGIDVLRIVQDTSPQTRIILLSARRTFQSALKAIRTRVYDYLVIPVNRLQLIRTVQRALNLLPQPRVEEAKSIYTVEQPVLPLIYDRATGIQIDLNRRKIHWGEETIRLTSSETRLLRAFLENPGRVLSHIELVKQVQGYESSEAEAPLILRPLVSRLRQKISRVPGGEGWIVNIRGAGYMYERRSHLNE